MSERFRETVEALRVWRMVLHQMLIDMLLAGCLIAVLAAPVLLVVWIVSLGKE